MGMTNNELHTDRCKGHPASEFDPMGQTVYCDGSCRCDEVVDDDDDLILVSCEACGGPAYVLGILGTLGIATHYRCRNCGWTFGG